MPALEMRGSACERGVSEGIPYYIYPLRVLHYRGFYIAGTSETNAGRMYRRCHPWDADHGVDQPRQANAG